MAISLSPLWATMSQRSMVSADISAADLLELIGSTALEGLTETLAYELDPTWNIKASD